MLREVTTGDLSNFASDCINKIIIKLSTAMLTIHLDEQTTYTKELKAEYKRVLLRYFEHVTSAFKTLKVSPPQRRRLTLSSLREASGGIEAATEQTTDQHTMANQANKFSAPLPLSAIDTLPTVDKVSFNEPHVLEANDSFFYYITTAVKASDKAKNLLGLQTIEKLTTPLVHYFHHSFNVKLTVFENYHLYLYAKSVAFTRDETALSSQPQPILVELMAHYFMLETNPLWLDENVANGQLLINSLQTLLDNPDTAKPKSRQLNSLVRSLLNNQQEIFEKYSFLSCLPAAVSADEGPLTPNSLSDGRNSEETALAAATACGAGDGASTPTNDHHDPEAESKEDNNYQKFTRRTALIYASTVAQYACRFFTRRGKYGEMNARVASVLLASTTDRASGLHVVRTLHNKGFFSNTAKQITAAQQDCKLDGQEVAETPSFVWHATSLQTNENLNSLYQCIINTAYTMAKNWNGKGARGRFFSNGHGHRELIEVGQLIANLNQADLTEAGFFKYLSAFCQLARQRTMREHSFIIQLFEALRTENHDHPMLGTRLETLEINCKHSREEMLTRVEEYAASNHHGLQQAV